MVKSSKRDSSVQASGQTSTPDVTAMYTDGACSGNPGPGGWGAIAQLSNGQVHEIGGAARDTTNNRMEIQAAIEILRWFAASPQTKAPVLYTDSKYVQDGITKWIKGWKKKNWKTTAGKAVLNQDLWQQLDAITQTVNAQLTTPVQWRYVKGHAGNEGNERCDAIARAFSKGGHPALVTVSPWGDDSQRSLASAAIPAQADNESKSPEEPDVMEATEEPKAVAVAALEMTEAAASSQANSSDLTVGKTHEGGAPPNQQLTQSDTQETFGERCKEPNPILNHIIERLRITDEIASSGYWVTTEELAEVLDLSIEAIEAKGDRWVWRNWSILHIRQQGMPSLWQLERVD